MGVYSECDRLQDRETPVKWTRARGAPGGHSGPEVGAGVTRGPHRVTGRPSVTGRPRSLVACDADQLDRQPRHEVDVGVERIDGGAGDLHPEGTPGEGLAGAVGVVPEPELEQLPGLDGRGRLEPHLVLAKHLAGGGLIDELQDGSGRHGARPYMNWPARYGPGASFTQR